MARRRHTNSTDAPPAPSSTQSKSSAPPDTVAERAHERFLARGAEHGHDLEDWLEAEREVSPATGERLVDR